MAPLWSIAVEETFYLIFPMFCFLLMKDWIISVFAVSLLLISPALRNTFTDTLALPGVADLLAAGCLTAQISHVYRGMRIANPLPAIIMWVSFISLCVTMSVMFFRTDFRWAMSLIAVLTSFYLFMSSRVQCPRFVERVLWPLAFMGRMSLQLYVFHDMFHFFGTDFGISRWITFPATVLFAWVLEWSFIGPCNRFIRQLYIPASVRRLSSVSDTPELKMLQPSV